MLTVIFAVRYWLFHMSSLLEKIKQKIRVNKC